MTADMTRIGGLPYAEVRFDRHGNVIESPSSPSDATDLIVLNHGWKNGDRDARELYGRLGDGVAANVGTIFGSDRRAAFLGVLWPALRFAPPPGPDLAEGSIPIAAFDGADLPARDLLAYAKTVATELGHRDPESFSRSALLAAGGGGAADNFLVGLRGVLSGGCASADDEHSPLLNDKGRDLLEAARDEPVEIDPSQGDGDEDAAAALSLRTLHLKRSFAGGKAAVGRLLNQGTYYEMKTRAGLIGVSLAKFLVSAALEGKRVHLVGHSFGARLAAACAGAGANYASLSLLQAAFSQYGLGRHSKSGDGAFRRIIAAGTVSGPIVATHTLNDDALRHMYPLASAAAFDTSSGWGSRLSLGGPDARFGALGANGTQGMAAGESLPVAFSGSIVPLPRGKVANVLADAFIHDHNDVGNPSVAMLVASAIVA